MYETKAAEKIKTHIVGSITFFLSKNRTVHELMWKNIADPRRSKMTTWRMRIAFCIPKAI
jgi:hypothetical protein